MKQIWKLETLNEGQDKPTYFRELSTAMYNAERRGRQADGTILWEIVGREFRAVAESKMPLAFPWVIRAIDIT